MIDINIRNKKENLIFAWYAFNLKKEGCSGSMFFQIWKYMLEIDRMNFYEFKFWTNSGSYFYDFYLPIVQLRCSLRIAPEYRKDLDEDSIDG